MINQDVMTSNLDTSHVSQKFDEENNNSGERGYFEDTQVNPNSIETMDDNPDDNMMLMRLSQGGNDDIKIKVKDYEIDEFNKDDPETEATKFYESDDEEKNYTKANLKNNSREEQLKLVPSIEGSMIEMEKLRASCLSGESDFKTDRELGFQELQEKLKHFRKTAHQYEKLYGKYLEKFIVAERERVVLMHQTQRANYLIQKTAYC